MLTKSQALQQLAESQGFDDVIDFAQAIMIDRSSPTICLSCGETGPELEPDTCNAYCTSCKSMSLWAAEELCLAVL